MNNESKRLRISEIDTDSITMVSMRADTVPVVGIWTVTCEVNGEAPLKFPAIRMEVTC